MIECSVCFDDIPDDTPGGLCSDCTPSAAPPEPDTVPEPDTGLPWFDAPPPTEFRQWLDGPGRAVWPSVAAQLEGVPRHIDSATIHTAMERSGRDDFELMFAEFDFSADQIPPPDPAIERAADPKLAEAIRVIKEDFVIRAPVRVEVTDPNACATCGLTDDAPDAIEGAIIGSRDGECHMCRWHAKATSRWVDASVPYRLMCFHALMYASGITRCRHCTAYGLPDEVRAPEKPHAKLQAAMNERAAKRITQSGGATAS